MPMPLHEPTVSPDPSQPDTPRNTEEDEENIENNHLAAAKAIEYLMAVEIHGCLCLEKSSVYGAAVAIPQIARSAGWPGTLTGITCRTYMFLALNIFLQLFLLTMIGESANVVSPFGGKMHLCDFGRDLQNCPDGPNCRGPSGTTMEYSRLFDYNSYNTRNFVRTSMLALFPERKKEIMEKVDPGEYGLENYYCRAVCCFIFSMAVASDLKATLQLCEVLFRLPNEASTWIRYEYPSWDLSKDNAKAIFGWSELHLVKYGLGGMSIGWKLWTVIAVVIPKLAIWLALTSSGFRFLMETAGIVDVIMNSMALTFILSIDELVFEVLTTVPAKHIMNNLEDYDLYSVQTLEALSNEEICARYRHQELGPGRWRSFLRIVAPKRLLLVMSIFAMFMAKYYLLNCTEMPDGSWVSKPMYLPSDLGSMNPFKYMFQQQPTPGERPFWTMPVEN